MYIITRRFRIIFAILMFLILGMESSFADKIRKIVINGISRIEDNVVTDNTLFKVGDDINQSMLDKTIKRLYDTGLFQDIKIYSGTSSSADAGIVYITVVESPLIKAVAIEGNKRIKREDIEPDLLQVSRSVLNKVKVQQDLETIKKLYQKQSRYHAKVEAKVIYLPQNRVNLVYEIDEGPKTLIGNINFVGNNEFSAMKLKDVLLTKEDRWYRFLSGASKFDYDKIKYDRENLVNFYMSRGFADIQLEQPVVEYSSTRGLFDITFVINEGQVYRYGKTSVENANKKIDTKEVEKLISIKNGDQFNMEDVSQVVQTINGFVSDKGYPFNYTDYKIEKNYSDKIVDIVFSIDDGPKLYVDQIDIHGNVRTVDKVIRREFKISEGDPYRNRDVQRAEKRIKDLDYFEEVKIIPTPSAKSEDKVTIDVEVKEKSTGQFNISTGISTTQGILGKFGYNDHNLAGRGLEVDLSMMKSKRDVDFKTSITDPYFMDYDLSLGIELEKFIYDKSVNQDRNYSQYTKGGALSFGYEIIDKLGYKGFYSYKEDNIKDIATNSSILLTEQAGKKTISSIGHSLTWDGLDSNKFPTKGMMIRVGQEISGIFKGVKFLRNEMKVAYYRPVYKKDVVLLLQASAGRVQSINNDRIPISERFFVNGDDMRGFRSGGIGPRDKTTGEAVGANNFYLLRTQLSMPIGLPKEVDVRGMIFGDMGSAFGIDSKNYVSSSSIKSLINDSRSLRGSVGAGIIWNSPIGVVGLSISKPMKKRDFDKEKLLRFSIMSEL